MNESQGCLDFAAESVVVPLDRTTTLGVTGRISRFALQQRSRIDQAEAGEGIRRLMWAILKDTLRSYYTCADAKTVRKRRLFRDAERWIQSRETRWLFSFESICAVLNVDSEFLRNEVRRWMRNKRNGHGGANGIAIHGNWIAREKRDSQR